MILVPLLIALRHTPHLVLERGGEVAQVAVLDHLNSVDAVRT